MTLDVVVIIASIAGAVVATIIGSIELRQSRRDRNRFKVLSEGLMRH
jgi:hypothetical protein